MHKLRHGDSNIVFSEETLHSINIIQSKGYKIDNFFLNLFNDEKNIYTFLNIKSKKDLKKIIKLYNISLTTFIDELNFKNIDFNFFLTEYSKAIKALSKKKYFEKAFEHI